MGVYICVYVAPFSIVDSILRPCVQVYGSDVSLRIVCLYARRWQPHSGAGACFELRHFQTQQTVQFAACRNHVEPQRHNDRCASMLPLLILGACYTCCPLKPAAIACLYASMSCVQ